MVRVRLFAALREAAGVSEVEVAPAAVGALLEDLCDRFGLRFRALLPTASVLLDGRRAGSSELARDGAEIALLPPFSGGQ